MIHLIPFLIGFVAGPLAFWVLAKQTPTRRYMVILWLASVVLVLAALGMHYLLAEGPYVGLAIILAFWMGWIVVLALLTLAMRRRNLPARTKRIVFGLAAAATTVPWFGLYTAQMVSA